MNSTKTLALSSADCSRLMEIFSQICEARLERGNGEIKVYALIQLYDACFSQIFFIFGLRGDAMIY